MDKQNVTITRSVLEAIQAAFRTHTPECGGVLGGKRDGTISIFYFDASGKSHADGYTPDVNAINKVLLEWRKADIFMVGMIHSHANGNNVPSCGDLSYVIRILSALNTVDHFLVPIVTNCENNLRIDWYDVRILEGKRLSCQPMDCIVVEEASQ